MQGVTPYPPDFAERYRKLGYWEDRPLIDHYLDAFARWPDRLAIIDDTESLTYAELAVRSERVARRLVDLGLRTGDRIVVQLPNSALFVSFYLALQHIGAIPVMALPSHRYREVSQFVRLAGAVALASPASERDVDFVSLFDRLQAEEPGLRLHITSGSPTGPTIDLASLHTVEPQTTSDQLAELRLGIDPEHPAVFQLSGGTTGIPKLIPRTHNDYACNSKLAVAVCDVRDGDVLFDVLPISHNLPLACPGLQGFLFSGATVSLSTSTRPIDVFARLERDGVTHIHLVPALLIMLINDPAATEHALETVRVIQSGGQRLQPETRQRAESTFARATVQENFGMAEGLLMFVRLDDPREVRLETVGRPVCPDDEVKLVDEEGRDVDDGEVGEMWARGPYTLRGYYNAPEHNARSFSPDGFYMSGDLMVRHPSGNYIVAGRKKDLINRGGEKISAEEIENLVLSHPAVMNVACVPVDDAVLGERMCACIVLRPGTSLTLPQLVDHLKTFELARHKLPEYLQLYGELPLSPVGKISKKQLVADLREQAPTRL